MRVLQRLLAQIAADAPEWRLFFDVLAWSGLRIGEAIELRWKDVDLGIRTVHVRRRYSNGRVGPPKTKYGRRRLRLTPELARALWTHRGGAGDGDLVFVTLGRRDRSGDGGGTRISPSNLMRRVLKPAAVRAGLGTWVPDPSDNRKLRAESWVGFHTFRHTCATVLFRRGWNAVQVQKWLGHHKPSFTLDTYVHLLDEDVPEPEFFDTLTARANPVYHLAYQDSTKQPEAVVQVSALNRPISNGNADQPREAETA
jgi:integrase